MTFNLILEYLNWNMLFSLLIAAMISRIAIPPVVRVARAKKLVSVQNGRSSHLGTVPYLGGIPIFAALAISASLFVKDDLSQEFQYIFPAILIIFFIGLKDDIVNIRPLTKLYGQILASLLVIILADVRISTLHGILGIGELNLIVSYLFTLLVFVALINAFNLSDGIDGLASGLGIQISLIFGFWLAFLQHDDYAVLAFALVGGLIPFYLYNVFGKKYKLFMGDTGSLLIGLIFSILAVKVLGCELPTDSMLYASALPMLVVSVMIISIADTIRVFVFRISKGKSPFHADKNHFHHYLIALGINHWKASTIIIISNTALFLLAFSLRNIGDIKLGFLVFGLAFAITLTPRIILELRKKDSTRRGAPSQ